MWRWWSTTGFSVTCTETLKGVSSIATPAADRKQDDVVETTPGV